MASLSKMDSDAELRIQEKIEYLSKNTKLSSEAVIVAKQAISEESVLGIKEHQKKQDF